jgi:integrase
MGLYKRSKFYWVSYAIPAEMARRLGCPRVIRESTGSTNKEEAKEFEKKRRAQIANGSWHTLVEQSGSILTLNGYVQRWHDRREHRGIRSAKRDFEMLAPFMPTLGQMRIGQIERQDVRRAVDAMRDARGKRGKAKDKAYAPMTVHRCYGVLRACFRSALREGLVTTNPCTLTTLDQELPKRADADPNWRKQAVFKPKEIVALISDERVPEIRRMLYGLTFFGGLRLGEAVARTWGNYDPEMEPLGELKVATQHDGRRLKTDNPRDVPVHPTLAKMLASWRERYAIFYGEEPTPDALIVRNVQGGRFLPSTTLENLQNDLKKLGLRRRRFHDLRRSFVTLARAGGASSDLLLWVTHTPGPGMMDVYTTPTWESLCAQVSCLKLELPKTPSVPTRKGHLRAV